MSSKTLRAEDLAQFTGTTYWVRHWLNPAITYTDGARHVAQAGEAYWLLDAIVSHQLNAIVAAEEFQVWTLMRVENNAAILTCEDGDGNHIIRQDIGFTDFPLPMIQLWFQNKVIFLPSEY
jgi:hypothetical protein